MVDALSEVYQGREGSGGAQILPSSYTAQEVGQIITAPYQRQYEERKKSISDVSNLLSNDIKSKWDVDNVTYFAPRQQQLRQEGIELFKKSKNGIIDPIELARYKQKLSAEQQMVDASNSQFAQLMQQKRQLEEDIASGKNVLDAKKSLENIEKLTHPEKYFPDEVKAAGGAVQWRANNFNKYGLIPQFDLNQFIIEQHKGLKLSERLDEKSKKIILPGVAQYTQVSEIPIEQTNNTLKAALTSPKAQNIMQALIPVVQQRIAQSTANWSQMTPEQQQARFDQQLQVELPKVWNEFVNSRLGKSENVRVNFHVKDAKTEKSAGQARRDSFTFTPTMSKPSNIPSWAEPVQNLFGKKEEPYVALNYDKTAADNNPLYLNDGRQVNPLGFQKTKTGWQLVGREVKRVPDGSGGFVTQENPVIIPFSEKEDVARMAAYVGYDNVEDFEKKLENEASRVSKGKPSNTSQGGGIDLSKFDKTK